MPVNLIPTKERSGSYQLKNFLAVLLLFFAVSFAFGQENRNSDKVVIGDLRYILHNVQRNETLYSIARMYECTQEEVLAANKNLTGVIQKGMVLKIPDHTYQKPQSAKVDENKFIQYQTVSGDNYYQLKLRYGVEEEELLKFNPDLKEGLKAGKIILIPIKSKSDTEIKPQPVSENRQKESPAPVKISNPGQMLNVGLYLPISAAVTDSLKPTAKSLSFLAFYQGVLMAVDKLAKSGINVKLFVYDTEKSNSNVESLIKKPEFLDLDLVIGPVYPEVQHMVSELTAKNRILMVSPLSADDKYTKINPWYFQVNPVKKIRLETTADYLLKEFPREKITFLEGGNGSQETRQIREHLEKIRAGKENAKGLIHTYNLWEKGIDELEPQLQSDKPNILVMADLNEVNVSIAMNRLTLLSKKYPLILIGLQELTRMQSIEIENLHNVNLRFLTNYFVNYSLPPVSLFMDNFKTEFGTEPTQFAFQGYDIATFFLKSIQKKGNSVRNIQLESDAGLLNTTYHFKKISDFGGYTNDNFTVVEYANNFEVRELGVIRHKDQ